jgi:hypothetical protein
MDMQKLIHAVDEAAYLLSRDPYPCSQDAARNLRAALAEMLQQEVRKHGT